MDDKVKSFKEHKIKKNADKNFELINKYQTNPITARMAAFKKTKKEIDLKDLF